MTFTFSLSRAACHAGLATLSALTGLTASATEGGGSIYPHGSDNFTAGVVPPPGTYGMVFASHYSADRVNDSNGNDLRLPGFKVTVNAVAPRFIWVPGNKILGGDFSVHTIVPVVDVDVSVAGQSQRKTGLGDITTGVGLGYHHSANLHSVVAVDFFLPTGRYQKGDLANIGRNAFAFEPVYVLTYVDPNGFNGDIKAGYTFNTRNKDTDYRSGQEFHFDYALGWGFGNGVTAGVGGYVYQQVTVDRQAGADLANSKGKAFAIGPSVKWDSGKGWFVTLKWQKETMVENRAAGNAFYLKAVFPL